MITADELTEALRDEDEQRARSQQVELGASELGMCRRRAAYRLARTEPTDRPFKGAALVGTAIHAEVLPALGRRLELLVELPVVLGGVPGHVDLAGLRGRTLLVLDLKTKDGRAFEGACAQRIPREWDYQTAVYAEAVRELYPAEDYDEVLVGVVLMSRDTGELHVRTWAHDPATAAAALDWKREVEQLLEAGGGPDWATADRYGPSDEVCQGCPWLTRCWVQAAWPEDPPPSAAVAAAVDEYEDARRRVARAKDDQDRARALLDAAGPYRDEQGRKVSWSGGKVSSVDDGEAALELLDAAGIPRPQRDKTSARRITVTAAKLPGK